MTDYTTEQEQFWAGEFGDEYIDRNRDPQLVASALSLFSDILSGVNEINSVLEFGANIGINLQALRYLLPDTNMTGVEINEEAVQRLNELSHITGIHESIFDFETDTKRDFVFTRGLLIHLDPDRLDQAYDVLYSCTKRYLLTVEYYNPEPVQIPYRGHENKLFKRDFAGELLDKFDDLKLDDYGFVYHRDPMFPQDDISWFLMKKDEN